MKSHNFSNIEATSSKLPVAILISGRGSNMKALIEAAKNPRFPAEIVLVLSNKKEAAGLQFAKDNGIKTATIESKNRTVANQPFHKAETLNQEDLLSEKMLQSADSQQRQNFNQQENFRLAFEQAMNHEILASGAKLICLAGFMRLLSPWFVDFWQGRLINIHPSLLPSFKGGNAVQDALDAKVKISGCTTHFVSKEMDSGEIIMQQAVPVLEGDNKESLAQRILQAEHEIYPLTLSKICKEILFQN